MRKKSKKLRLYSGAKEETGECCGQGQEDSGSSRLEIQRTGVPLGRGLDTAC